jgi:hypothetical protein
VREICLIRARCDAGLEGTGIDDELAEVLLPRKKEEGQRLVGVTIEGPA